MVFPSPKSHCMRPAASKQPGHWSIGFWQAPCRGRDIPHADGTRRKCLLLNCLKERSTINKNHD